MELSRIEEVNNLREVWKTEAEFTSWLSLEENLELLGKEIGISVSLIKTEASVGKLRVDILAEEYAGRKVVIENQLEQTDHDHLGKITAYASGFDAEFIVWIAKSIREEHKRAIDWLNKNTVETVSVFAIEITVWKIGNSLPAPKFRIVAGPNDLARIIEPAGSSKVIQSRGKSSNKSSKLSPEKLHLYHFWTDFKEYAQKYAEDNNVTIKLASVNPKEPSWYNIWLISAKAYIELLTTRNELSCDLRIKESEELYLALDSNKDAIEEDLSEKLEWMGVISRETSKAKQWKIRLTGDSHINIQDKDKWPEYHSWLLEKVLDFQRVFIPYIEQHKKASG